MSNKFKVLINQKEEIDLFKYDLNDIDYDNINNNIINNNRPIAYHNFCYDSKKQEYKSIDKFNLNENSSINLNKSYLYEKNLKFVHERYKEMCYICSHELESSILMWSWEFDRQFEITELIINILFMTFEEEGEISWYISTDLSNNLKNQFSLEDNNIIQDVKNEFYKLPLDIKSPVYFDQRINLTNIIKNSNKFYLACIIDNNEDQQKNQLFRSKYKINIDELDDSETFHKPQKFDYPFSIFFNLSLKNDISFFNQNKKNQILNGNIKKSKYLFREEIDASFQRIKKNQALHWSSNRVEDWLFDLGFNELVPKFKYLNVDGKKLMENGLQLLPDYFLQNPKKRKRYIKSLNNLLSNSNMELIQTSSNKSQNNSNTISNNNNTVMQHLHQLQTTPLRFSHRYSDSSILILENQNYLDEQFQIDLNGSSLISSHIQSMNFTDFKVILENEEFLISKELIKNQSDYFKSLFNSDFNENLKNEIIFQIEPENGLTKDIFKLVLELSYLYSNDMRIELLKKLELDQIVLLLKISDRLFFNQLKNIIEKYIIWNINSSNLTDYNQLFKFNDNINLFTRFLLKFNK